MANTHIKMLKLRWLLNYYTSGVSKRQISLLIKISRNTVKRYIYQFLTLYITNEDAIALSDKQLDSLFMKPYSLLGNERFDKLQEIPTSYITTNELRRCYTFATVA